MEKKKYYANMVVNRDTWLRKNLTGTNYKELARSISKIAKGNCFVGNEFTWNVWDEKNIIRAAGAGRKTTKGFEFFSCSHLIGKHT